MVYSAFVDCIYSLFKSESQDAPLTDDQRRRKVRQDVENMLAYAVKQPNINVQPDLLQHTVPLLCRKFGELTEDDHVRLWDSYNNLSILIRPVTVESIAVAEQFNSCARKANFSLFWHVISAGLLIVIVFLCQAYSTLLSTGLNEYYELVASYNKVLDDQQLAGANKGGNGTLDSVLHKKKILEQELFFAAKTQCKTQGLEIKILGSVIRESDFCKNNTPFLGVSDEADRSSIGNETKGSTISEATPNNTQFNAEDNQSAGVNGIISPKTIHKNPQYYPPFESQIRDVFDAGTVFIKILEGLILPVLMGCLGAIAFVIRRILDQIADTTFVMTYGPKTWMRVMLGGLLGFLGIYLYTSGNVEKMGLGLSLFAFLMGYSVEMAFSILDRFIAFLRESVKPQSQQLTSAPVMTTTVPTPPSVAGGTGTTQGNLDANSVADARQQLAEVRRQLRESLTLTPILEKVLPPELFEQMVKPRSEAATALLTALGSESAAGTDTAVMALARQASAEGRGLIDGNHPLVLLLSGALGSFEEAAKDRSIPLDTTKFVQSIFSGSVAAFKHGAGTYERWSAFLLGQPHVARLTAGLQASAEAGKKTLSLSGIFKTFFAQSSDALAKELMKLGLSDTPTDQLTEALWSGGRKLENFDGDLAAAFANNKDEFEEGWADYRRCLLRQILVQQDFPEDVFTGFEDTTLPVSETLASVEALRENRISAKDLDILSLLSDELMKASQANTEMDVIGMIQRLLPFAQTKQSRTSQDEEA